MGPPIKFPHKGVRRNAWPTSYGNARTILPNPYLNWEEHIYLRPSLPNSTKINKFDFVVLEIDEDELVPIILGRPFIVTARATINVHEGKFSIRVGSETVTFDIRKSVRSMHSRDDYLYCAGHTVKLVREEWVDMVDHDSKWIEEEEERDPKEVQAVSIYLKPESIGPLEWKALKNQLKPSMIEPPKLELKELPKHLEYDFLQGDDQLHVVISSALFAPKNQRDLQSELLIERYKILKSAAEKLKLNIVLKGNIAKSMTTDNDGNLKMRPPVTAEKHQQVQREENAKTILLSALPDEHMGDFYHIIDARDIWNVIKARFSRNTESKKMQKSLLKQKFEEFKIFEEEGLDKGYDKMQKILTQMNTLKIKPEQEDVNMKFLRGLPPSWSDSDDEPDVLIIHSTPTLVVPIVAEATT
nr:ribonuclease H-like domain, reverse transcriptase, RNA-dependent DNA polymerase [Tanacetum cinerariifolium]